MSLPMRQPAGHRELVWDPLVRLFHWSLAAAFLAGWLSRASDYDLHLAAGYTVLGLVTLRVLWGFLGTRHARFRDFAVGPVRLARYLAGLVRGTAPRYLGHNPAGGVMILALLAVLAAIGVSGIMLDAAENRTGPLSGFSLFLYTDAIKRVHSLATDLTWVLVLLHLAGVAHASLLHRENLIGAMVTGRKRPVADEESAR